MFMVSLPGGFIVAAHRPGVNVGGFALPEQPRGPGDADDTNFLRFAPPEIATLLFAGRPCGERWHRQDQNN
jgi:hypothetical protein